MEETMAQIAQFDAHAYAAKPEGYFEGARADYVSDLPVNSQAKILEVGCGEGGTGWLALQHGKCGTYCGVELLPDAGDKARKRLSEVVVGNVESMNLPWPEETFDVLILSEVLEHLRDPWAVLEKLFPLLKPGAAVYASSPNVSNHKIIRMLIQGDWNLTDMGVMDRTHLRWFTPRTYKHLFESCGYAVDFVGPMGTLSPKARAVSMMSFGRLRHLFIEQVSLRAHRP